MKNILFYLSLSLLFIIHSCKEDDDSNVSPSSNNKPSFEDCIEYLVNDEAVNFSASCAVQDDSLSWDFGDGATSNDFSPTHTYSDTGSFQVELKVIKAKGGLIRTSSTTVRVLPTCKICACNFPMDPETSYMEFCGTSEEAEDWCTSTCYTNNYCNSCSDK